MSSKGQSLKKSGIDHKILWPSVLIIVLLAVPFSFDQEQSMVFLNNMFEGIVNNFGWGYLWYTIILLVAAVYMCCSKYGNVVLGDPTDKPQFTLFEYSAILVAMGLGSTVIRTGMTEWANIALDPPFGLTPGSLEAISWGNPYGMFLWGFQTFAIFVMAAPAMGYIIHVRKRPLLRISEVFRCIWGDKFTDGIGGKIIDIFFLVSIMAGASVTLGLGTPIVTNVIAKLLNQEVTFMLTLIVTIIWVMLFTASAYMGVEKGIKNLSTLNVYLAAGFGLFIMILGPGVFILNHFTDSMAFLTKHYVDFSLYTESLAMGEATYMQRNTIFYFAYSATWALLHSVFAAKISKGRTIKEMILTYLLAPLALSWIATGVLGGLSIERELTGVVPVLEIVKESGALAAIPHILESLPMATLAMIIFVVVTMIFLTTTLDSTTYTIAAYASTNDMSKEEPPKSVRLLTALIITVLGMLLMRIGGLAPLEVLSGMMGIPIIFIQLLSIYAAIKMMKEDKAHIYNVRPKIKDEEDNARDLLANDIE